MPTQLRVPKAYRPWPNEDELNRNSPTGDWRDIPDDFRPYLGQTATGTKSPSVVRKHYAHTWAELSRVNVDELLAANDALRAPAAEPARPAADGDGYDGAGEDTTEDINAQDPNADIGGDELSFTTIDHDDDGRLIYRDTTTLPDGTHVPLNARGEVITDGDGHDIVTDEEGHPLVPNREGSLLGLDEDGYVYYIYKTIDKKKRVAADGAGNVLKLNGRPIELDEDMRPIPVEPSMLSKVIHGARKSEDTTEEELLYDINGVPVRDFEVPGVGKGPGGDGPVKSRHRILAILAGVALFAGGGMYYWGIHTGSSRVPAESAISPQEAEDYHLTKYDYQGASAFGKDYLTICLTSNGEAQQAARKTYLDKYQSKTSADNCGIQLSDAVKMQPMSINPNGVRDDRPAESHGDGLVSYLGYNVSMSDGSFVSYSLPIWAGMANGLPSYRVVGTPGKTPPVQSAPVDSTDGGFAYDNNLARQLESPLKVFFDAWGSSDSDKLAAATTSDATGMAKEGMDGQVDNPSLVDARVVPSVPPTSKDGSTYKWDYKDGDEVVALVNVRWENPTSSEPLIEQNGYRVTLVLTGGKWQVKDISGGLITEGEGRGSTAGGGSAAGELGSMDDLGTE